MKITSEFNYRNARQIIEAVSPYLLPSLSVALSSASAKVNLAVGHGKSQRYISAQVQSWFAAPWKAEAPCFAVPDMRYDLLYQQQIPGEIELGHQRLVYADFFKFLADYAQQRIPAAFMIVTGDPHLYGHDWHCSLDSTRRKIEAIASVYLVPTLVIGVDP